MNSYRDSELHYLDESYENNKNDIIIMYGQKYIGKHYLLKDYLKDKPNIVLCATDATARQQRYLWGRLLREKGYDISDYPSFYDIFKYIFHMNVSNKMVLCIEDFDIAVKTDSSFFDDLIVASKEESEVQIILCSSAVGWIENTMVSKIGKNAFSISGFLKIRPLPYLALKEQFYNYSAEECLQLYSVLGGYPGLWRYCDESYSIRENITKNILTQGTFLNKAALHVLGLELRELGVYSTILAGLAEGKYKLNDLHEYTQFSRPKVSVYLKNLMELEIVEKMYSIDTEGRDNTQKGIYHIKHPLIRFYYTFLYGRQPDVGEENAFYTNKIQHEMRSFADETYQEVCTQYIQVRNLNDKLAFRYEKIGKWVGKAGMIPIVANDKSGRFLVGLCSYEKPVMTYQDYEWLFYLMQQARIAPEFIYLFSVHGFDEKILLEARVKGNIKTIIINEIR